MQGLHKARVTCSKWSLNGMKLFTGDDQGLVVCTEFDAFQVMNINVYVYTDDTACMHDLFIHMICSSITQNLVLIFLPHSQCTYRTPKFTEYKNLYTNFEFSLNAANLMAFSSHYRLFAT